MSLIKNIHINNIYTQSNDNIYTIILNTYLTQRYKYYKLNNSIIIYYFISYRVQLIFRAHVYFGGHTFEAGGSRVSHSEHGTRIRTFGPLRFG